MLDDLLVRGNPRVNIPIYAGDLINVPQTIDITISCLGEVENPSVLSFRSDERITLHLRRPDFTTAKRLADTIINVAATEETR